MVNGFHKCLSLLPQMQWKQFLWFTIGAKKNYNVYHECTTTNTNNVFQQCILTIYHQCVPAVYTNRVYQLYQNHLPTINTSKIYQQIIRPRYQQSVPTMYINTAFQQCIPTTHTNNLQHIQHLTTCTKTVYQQYIIAPTTNTKMYKQCIPTLHKPTIQFNHVHHQCISTMYTHSPYKQCVPTLYTINI